MDSEVQKLVRHTAYVLIGGSYDSAIERGQAGFCNRGGQVQILIDPASGRANIFVLRFGCKREPRKMRDQNSKRIIESLPKNIFLYSDEYTAIRRERRKGVEEECHLWCNHCGAKLQGKLF
ncbi:hypothetical protein MKW98_009368 [Papaver atlanticum]|uniref:Uncharacterized protein n=1 Tax=Papaver atlanticum TaxID=357466 RepID=A0AAD4X524_9MAGN|nr:hypothetical protein MKW98_009368 [Papaver atlanticum]